MNLYLLDTNVIVYPYDEKEKEKNQRADVIIKRLVSTRRGVLSAQNLAEFANVILKKSIFNIDAKTLYRHIEIYEKTFTILPLTPAVVLEAVRGVRDYKFSYFDAQIWATAKLNHIPYILSEDFNQTTIEGITFINPFGQNFDPENL